MRPVSLFNETGATVQPQDFLNALAPAFARYEAQFTDLGFAPIRTAWLNRATYTKHPSGPAGDPCG